MALALIGAGFGRTGTYSLKSALEEIGFGPCHHMSEVIRDDEQIRLWAEAARGRPDFDRIFSGYRAAVDFPVASFWREVLDAMPDARVILSQRDADDWYESFSQTILPLILDRPAWPAERRAWFEMIEEVIVGKALHGRTDRAGVLAAYRENAEAVRELEADGRALVFRAGDGWGPLCEFLGVAVPDAPYPRTNARAEFFSAVKSADAAAD